MSGNVLWNKQADFPDVLFLKECILRVADVVQGEGFGYDRTGFTALNIADKIGKDARQQVWNRPLSVTALPLRA
ncbi:hypothetical protein [Celeribacter sp.]|uniref:hypothetical protein n=1 Tax=Celeribacter sp. TaxID=1890673 RepID=UPI003A94DD9F